MTDTATPASPRFPWGRILCQTVGGVAVVLGGWCLWLGFQPSTLNPEVEAFHDWKADPRDGELPAERPDEGFEPPTFTARITDVVPSEPDDSSGVVSAAGTETPNDEANVAVASYSPVPHGAAARQWMQQADAEHPAGAWLTGTIEEDAVARARIPAWKRTSKSLRKHAAADALPEGRR
jgi:hypothetical protein